MKWFINKLLTALIFLRYPKVQGPYRWFIRFQWIGHLTQIKYWIPDNMVKKPYKEVKFYGEFQQELLFILPFAYWHYLNGTLKKTISAKGMDPFYFFSPDHEERYLSRKWKGNYLVQAPNGPHNIFLSKYKWSQVPLKSYYGNSDFIFEKPLLIIANRYNTEWNRSPISFFDIPALDRIFSALISKYKIIYNRPEAIDIANDNSEVKNLNEKDWIRNEFPEVMILSDYYRTHSGKYKSYNELQLKIYANCERFISIHGGTAALASYFQGVNIIYSKEGHEHFLKEFEHTFTQLSGTKIHHVVELEELLSKISDVYLN